MRSEELQLKKQLVKIRDHQFSIPAGFNEQEAAELVMRALGATDSELRDDLGYGILCEWIIEKKLLGSEQLHLMLKQATSSEMLFCQAGNPESDTVFLRSFSSLLIALILYRDNTEHFLKEDEFKKVVQSIAHYCNLERDYRSFVTGKGWAHAPAHISDAIDECARSRFLTKNERSLLLQSVQALLFHAPHVFDAEEDERLATVLISLIKYKKIPHEDLLHWLDSVQLNEPDVPAHSAEMRDYLTTRINFKHFLRCLFMRFSEQSLISNDKLMTLFKIEHKYNPYFFNN
ncbi:DUF2785 domain-containing protein [Sporolactobacillus sp. THM19-2]|uniref:DUF2785 domain-containing protein n=1 Tax=Sporolactobacillus sp. THM19-2 TaxID=2511171 RepID=UPI00101F8307|nr:DUF2785 domain-containing protein [Sporolactobacillus sp. THM19-2]RYL88107.1 DUF2785 domain-containing protein [Sporolactobacillus sp. THM19-2]